MTNKSGSQITTLPDHLIVEHILSRLPVKPLIRFKCVSKYWLSTMSCREFAKIHLELSSSSAQTLILRDEKNIRNRFEPYSYYLSFDQHYNIKEFVELEDKYPLFNPSQNHLRTASIVDSCNGLVCLHNKLSCFYLWNPATNQCRNVEGPVINCVRDFEEFMCLGFGYISSVNDYRIGCMLMCKEGMFHIFIYSLKTGRWKEMASIDVNHYLPVSQGSVLYDDVIYWAPVVAVLETDEENIVVRQLEENNIVGLNLVTGQLKKIPLMKLNLRRSNNMHYFKVFQMKGCLALCCIEHVDSNEYFIKLCDVWMLKQYDDPNSWEKIYSFKSEGSILLNLFGTGKCLVSSCDFDRLILHDPSDQVAALEQGEDGTVIWEGIEDKPFFHYFIGDAWGYTESLISPFGTTMSDENGDDYETR